jgi:hypothetical protein
VEEEEEEEDEQTDSDEDMPDVQEPKKVEVEEPPTKKVATSRGRKAHCEI